MHHKKINYEDTYISEKKLNTHTMKVKKWIGILFLIVLFLVLFLMPKFGVQRIDVDGYSMEPTLQNDQSIFIEKLSYHFRKLHRGEVILFYPNGDTSVPYFIKRVAGVPGDTIQIKDGLLYVNRQVVESAKQFGTIEKAGIAEQEIYLKKDEYFALGDNYRFSLDSRDPSVGIVKKEFLAGRVLGY